MILGSLDNIKGWANHLPGHNLEYYWYDQSHYRKSATNIAHPAQRFSIYIILPERLKNGYLNTRLALTFSGKEPHDWDKWVYSLECSACSENACLKFFWDDKSSHLPTGASGLVWICQTCIHLCLEQVPPWYMWLLKLRLLGMSLTY